MAERRGKASMRSLLPTTSKPLHTPLTNRERTVVSHPTYVVKLRKGLRHIEIQTEDNEDLSPVAAQKERLVTVLSHKDALWDLGSIHSEFHRKTFAISAYVVSLDTSRPHGQGILKLTDCTIDMLLELYHVTVEWENLKRSEAFQNEMNAPVYSTNPHRTFEILKSTNDLYVWMFNTIVSKENHCRWESFVQNINSYTYQIDAAFFFSRMTKKGAGSLDPAHARQVEDAVLNLFGPKETRIFRPARQFDEEAHKNGSPLATVYVEQRDLGFKQKLTAGSERTELPPTRLIGAWSQQVQQ